MPLIPTNLNSGYWKYLSLIFLIKFQEGVSGRLTGITTKNDIKFQFQYFYVQKIMTNYFLIILKKKFKWKEISIWVFLGTLGAAPEAISHMLHSTPSHPFPQKYPFFYKKEGNTLSLLRGLCKAWVERNMNLWQFSPWCLIWSFRNLTLSSCLDKIC